MTGVYHHIMISQFVQSKTQIHIIKGNLKLFLKTTCFLKDFPAKHQTGARHSQIIPYALVPAIIITSVIILEL